MTDKAEQGLGKLRQGRAKASGSSARASLHMIDKAEQKPWEAQLHVKNTLPLHPQESQRAVDYYNELTKELPKRVNKLAQEVNKATLDASQDQSPYNHGLGADICVSCRKALSGQTVEAVNCLFHPACFKCYKCARPFTSADKPINIRDEPFCDSCSKGAFLAAMKTHGSAMLTPS
eukprot:g19985.t1